MTNNSRLSSAKTSTKPTTLARKWPWVLLALIILSLLLWAKAEFNYQQRISTLKHEVQSMERDVIKPAGGIADGALWVNCPHYDPFHHPSGLFILLLGWSDVICPEVTADWFIAIEPGKETDLMGSILQREGYKGSVGGAMGPIKSGDSWLGPVRSAEGEKGNLLVRIDSNPLNGKRPPYLAAPGKQWSLIGVSMHDKR